MPEFRSMAEFGRELDALAEDIEQDWLRRMTAEQAERAQDIARDVASAELGGDPHMSGWTPELDTKVTHFSDGAALLSPTKSSAGPWTVFFVGRNQGNAGGIAGPGVIQTGANAGTTARNKSGAVRKVRARKSRKWNGTTDPFTSPSAVQNPVERAAAEIAEKYGLKAVRKRFD